MNLTITRDDTDATTTLTLVGSVDLVSRGELVSAGTDALGADRALVLDMAGVEFLDSLGIGALVELDRVARSRGRSLTVSARSARVQRVLEVTGLDAAWADPATVG
ncbi:STAS domain-containing protein [Nocardioides sp. GY 10113]|uniref:STAS domain-containing protein n=1 Tax=Nocardioides sp. GY 10113 TaxID=2569761 RepID=UPI0010A83E2A|nr:STAS domain-containing protein [Nocardioides sp. GY 10113]TIC79243.1 STAS domain-containing protein [Nocardioides sp. GY 10113]